MSLLDQRECDDGPCQDCGRSYPPWYAPNIVWNVALGGVEAEGDPGGMLCPTCFLIRADDGTGIWRVAPGQGNDTPLRDLLRTIERTTSDLLTALDEGRYRMDPVHIRADLLYLRGEARRGLRKQVIQ